MSEQCRALVMSSSGIRLIYEIGAIVALNAKRPNETKWEYVYGSSGGSIVAAFLAQYKIGEEEKALDDMKMLVPLFLGTSCLKSHTLGPLHGICWYKGLYDSSPIQNFVKKHIDPEKIRTSGRHLSIVAVNYNTSLGEVFTEKDWENIHDIVISSCSIPFVYPPHQIPDKDSPNGMKWYGDGGTTDYVPLERALSNTLITHIDVILSIGVRENRGSISTRTGSVPSLHDIANTIMESFYGMVADRTDKIIMENNYRTSISKFFTSHPHNTDELLRGLTSKEKQGILDYIGSSVRKMPITYRIIRPINPIHMGSIRDLVNFDLFELGYNSTIAILDKEEGKGDYTHTFNF